MNDTIKVALDAYRQILPQYESCAVRTEALLIDLLKTEAIKVHFTESRAKTPESLRDKLNRPGKSYDDPLQQVPDLVGVRIVLYYQDDVARVGALIENEFVLLEEEHEHQPERYSPDQFGYLSMHYVVSVGESRSRLPEWKDACGIKVEIQVRTVLQHSWAAVSHALQYKREGDVPILLRRKLFRLAGLFELADEQFVNIRKEREIVLKSSLEAVRAKESGLIIDASVLEEFLELSEPFRVIEGLMKDTGKIIINIDKEESGHYIGEVVEELERLNINTSDDLNELLSKDYTTYITHITGASPWFMTRVFALLLILIASCPDDFTLDYLEEKGFDRSIGSRVLKVATRNRPS